MSALVDTGVKLTIISCSVLQAILLHLSTSYPEKPSVLIGKDGARGCHELAATAELQTKCHDTYIGSTRQQDVFWE